MRKKIDVNHVTLLILSGIAIILPFRDMLSEFVFSGFKIVPDILVLMFLLLFLYEKKFRLKFDIVDITYICFLLFAFISTLFINKEGIVRFILQIRSICLYYILYFIIKNIDIKQKCLINFGKLLSVVIYIIVGLSIIEVVTNKNFLFPQPWIDRIIYYDNFIRAYSVFNNPNTFAAFLIFSFIYKYQIDKDYWSLHNLPFTVVAFVGIYISVSRSTIMLLVAFLCIRLCTYVYECRKEKRAFQFHRYACVAIIVSLLCWGGVSLANTAYSSITSSDNNQSGALDRFGHLFNDKIVEESSTDGRIYNIKKGFEIFKDYKLTGTGFGTYGSAGSLMKESKLVEKYDLVEDLYSDNEYIVILVETGIIGSLLFVAFVAAIFWKYHKDFYKLAFCVVFAGLGMFYNVLEVQALAFLFWLCLALPVRHDIQQKNLA